MRPAVVDFCRGRWKHPDKRNKTIVLWAEGPYALDHRQGRKAHIVLSIQRNKMTEVLLR